MNLKREINDIIKWYGLNVNTPINDDFILYMIQNGLIKEVSPSQYDLNEINDFLLKKYNGELLKNEDGKYQMKDNRKALIESFKSSKPTTSKTPQKFKIIPLEGKKLKLVKLG